MPIVFEQPGPFDAASSRGGGAAQQYGRDLPSLAAQQRTLAGLYEAMAAAHRGGGGVARQVAAPDSGSGGVAQAGGAYRYQQPDPLTQAESMRLQRLQSARSAIQDQVSQGMLSAEDGNAMLLQVQTGIDPLRQRQERAMAQMREQQAQQASEDHARMTSLQAMGGDQIAQHFRNQAVPIRDENGRTVAMSIPDGRGGWHFHNLPRDGAGSRMDPLVNEQLRDFNANELASLNTQHENENSEATEANNREVAGLPEGATRQTIHQLTTAHAENTRRRHAAQAQARRELAARQRARHFRASQGLNPFGDTQAGPPPPVASGAGGGAQAPWYDPGNIQGMGLQLAGGQPPPAQQQPPAGGQPQPVGGQPAGAARPFERGSPGSPEQRVAVERFDDLRSQARGLSSPDTRAAVSSTIDQAEGLLTRFGSPAAMPAAERQQYTRLVQGLAASFPSQGSSAAGLRRAAAAARRYGVPDEFVAPLERYGSLDAMPPSDSLSLEVAFNRAGARRGHRRTDTQGLRRWLEARSREE